MIPNLTTEQRRENLEKAKAARQRRAAILKSVSDGSYSVVDVLNMALEDETVSRMKVFTLIKAAPGYGFARTQQTMKRLHIAESRRIKGLGANQRAALVELFGGALMIGRKLRAKKVNEGIEMPRYAHEGDAGLDLRITETVTLEPMQKCVVGCGLAVEIPSGCVGLVFPRSGLAAKQGITLSNSVGVIDSGYRGEVCAALINQSYETVTLEAGTRVCQLVVMPYVPCELVPVDELSDTERGAGGFGSTGVE